MPHVYLLQYGAGNWRSLVNAIKKLGYDVKEIGKPEDIAAADSLILPGVGHFGECMGKLAAHAPAIRRHVEAGKPFMGICVGMQALFEGSSEAPGAAGLGVIRGRLGRFDDARKSVPHIGWNSADASGNAADAHATAGSSPSLYDLRPGSKYYYVHSYRYPYAAGELEGEGWTVATATHGDETFVGAVARGNVVATQFHPEKSGVAGLRLLRSFLSGEGRATVGQRVATAPAPAPAHSPAPTITTTGSGLTRRIIACLDVRANDDGDLVVTKGDRYDVQEKATGAVRNLGKPVELARRYYEQGADEVTFLNITGFRLTPLGDKPMMEVLRRAAETVFVPLTVGGGIKDDDAGAGAGAGSGSYSAVDIAKEYFASGADKVSIGSDAVDAVEEYLRDGCRLTGRTSIERISRIYGCQAVVVSVDPAREYVAAGDLAAATAAAGGRAVLETAFPGPAGERYCWYACTTQGGRRRTGVDVVQLARAVERMGAGEILLNCIDRDGTGLGFDLELVAQVRAAVRIPVVASSGAGRPAHFADVFERTAADAALGAGIFHRGEYTVRQVKDHLAARGLLVRMPEGEL